MPPESDNASEHRADECAQVQRLLAVIGRSWAGATLWAVLDGAERYGEIKAAASGVSDAVLAARLRECCEAGLMVRTVHPGPPPAVSYRPTDAGRDLRPVLEALREYAVAHPAVDRN